MALSDIAIHNMCCRTDLQALRHQAPAIPSQDKPGLFYLGPGSGQRAA
jgi:hypothetical protein